MATLLLTAVGTVVGGPIGGAIGAIIGQQVDQNYLFAPKGRQGPRLGDLSVQTSSYGTQIPRLFGKMRVAGTVVWATDLAEHRSTSGGKGRPKVTNYSYSASFAVALSARRVTDVRRIWADGKLLRGTAGDFKSVTGFRLHYGDEDQPPDPLIAAAEGEAQAPAYRGLAYAVFEDLQLEDFGNRIPSLTFEVEADADDVAIGAIAEELGGGDVAAGPTPALAGYAAGGDSVRAAIEALADVVPLSLFDDGASLRLTAEVDDPLPWPAEAECERPQFVRRGQSGLPGEASIAYHDSGRDYQTGLQRAVRPGGRSADRRALPAVLSAGAAKALAEYRLAALWAARTRARAVLAWRAATLRPGSHFEMIGQPGLWKIERWTLGPMIVTLDLIRVSASAPPDLIAASPGRAVSEGDLPHGPTIVRLLDLPIGDGLETRPLLFVAAAGAEAGWRRAALSASYDSGESWQDAGGTAAPAAMGVTLGALPARGAALFDLESVLEVELFGEAMWLEGRSDDLLIGGANLAAIGDELVQFGVAQALGDRRFRLSRLLRGRRGTEWAAAGHLAGEPFTLIERDALVVVEAPAGSAGGEARILASGVGDPAAASAARAIDAAVLRPPSPVHLAARETGAGDLALSWVRRSRQGWSWVSGADTPLGEEAERYRLVLSGAGFERIAEATAPAYLYTAAERALDGGGPLSISVSQIGSQAASRPALLDLA
ncbi:MAG TPA: phage tail protein [Allosphingosinicella sp.]|nr:phage tail protein [Allosphingosinicella sp.]